MEKKKEEKSTQDKQFYWILGTMAGLIAIFLISSSVIESMKSFEHKGLTFTKEKFGDIPVYRYYYYTDPSPVTGQAISEPFLINVYLRNDPRTNAIPVEGEISFADRGKYIFITTNTTGLDQCDYTAVALSSMTSFLASNGYTVKGAIPDEELARKTGLRFTDCEDRPTNTVIEVREGEETKIELTRPNCYLMTINNCEVLEAAEKFMIQAVLDGKARQNLPGS